MFDHSDLLYAIACAAQESGLNWDGKSVPQLNSLQSAYIPATGAQTDGQGNQVTNSPRAQGLYNWAKNQLTVSEMADKAALVHEATHYLQNMSKMQAGFPFTPQRLKIENQAYDAERRAPYDCIGMFGGWNTSALAPRIKTK